jgi:glycosyltransferase involved in cell wall biosynthesis
MGELVSVVLPTYNRAAVVGRALRSVLAQTYGELDVIVVDDGSTDDTEAVVTDVQDPRVRYVRRGNGGPGAARNTGIALARGRYVAFQDSDDEWLPDKLTKQVAKLLAAPADVGLVVCGHREFRPETVNELTVEEFLARGDAKGSLLTGLWYVPATWLARRDVLERAGPFDESLPSCEDHDLAFRLSDVCRFECVPEILVLKHHTGGSVYDHAATRVEGFRRVLERHRVRWREAPFYLARQEYMLGYWLLLEQRRRFLGWRYLWQSVWHHPQSRWDPVTELLRNSLRGRAEWILRGLGLVRPRG